MSQGIQITCTSNPTGLAGVGDHGILHVTIRNRGTGALYLGGSAVTTAAGYALSSADSPLQCVLYVGESLYGCSTGQPVIDVLRLNETT